MCLLLSASLFLTHSVQSLLEHGMIVGSESESAKKNFLSRFCNQFQQSIVSYSVGIFCNSCSYSMHRLSFLLSGVETQTPQRRVISGSEPPDGISLRVRQWWGERRKRDSSFRVWILFFHSVAVQRRFQKLELRMRKVKRVFWIRHEQREASCPSWQFSAWLFILFIISGSADAASSFRSCFSLNLTSLLVACQMNLASGDKHAPCLSFRFLHLPR